MIKRFNLGEYAGFDIDGCMNNIEELMLERMWSFGKKYKKTDIVKPNSYYISEFLGTPKKDDIVFWRDVATELLENLKVRYGVKEALEHVRKSGKKIWIITSRSQYQLHDFDERNIENLTIEFLRKNNIPYDRISFNVQEKGTFCKNNGISFMVDDAPKNILDVTNMYIPVFIFNCFYNLDIEKYDINDLMTRVYSWEHFICEYDKILNNMNY